jgi:hypothetical protein
MDRAIARMAEIQRILEHDETLKAAAVQAEKAAGSHGEAQRISLNAENAVQDQRLKIEQNEASLYSGVVKNPKELQDLQNEVASLKRHLVTLEDRLLEAMVACEDTQAAYQDSQQRLEAERLRVTYQNVELTQELDELVKAKDKLTAERLAIAGSISEDLLTLYESLRRQKRGIAVSLITDNACEICGATLTPAQAQASRSSTQITNCPTCGRVLYGN